MSDAEEKKTVPPGVVLTRKLDSVLEITSPSGEVVYVSLISVSKSGARIGIHSGPGWNIARGEKTGVVLQAQKTP